MTADEILVPALEEQGFLPKRKGSVLVAATFVIFHGLATYYATYYAISSKIADLDKRVTTIEATYVPASVHAAKDATWQVQFSDLKESERRTGEDVREIRRMMEVRGH